ncbi:MAG: DNA-protecting protein DprA [Alphaproteobacteria bacterium]|nr:DNA-protecting protein DprA [Alphaproteobacteria bacterium]
MNKTETSNQFSDQEKLARLQLMRTDGVGPVLFRALIEKFGSGTQAIEGAVELSKINGRKRPLSPPSLQACEAELDQIERFGARVLFLGTAPYPERLAATDDAPPVLLVKGNTEHLASLSVGIVGARNASAAGMKFTSQIAAKLAEAKVTIVSGLARGIDTAAHQASLKAGTIACVAGGLDIHYPPENKALQEKIADIGLLVSEMPLGTRPQARHFPRRNRLISGLSDGVLVVEAAIKSGSLITARFAAEQGRDVFAVPGAPLDPRARGGNRLIKDGAILVESAEDILAELRPWQDQWAPEGHTKGTTEERAHITPAIGPKECPSPAQFQSVVPRDGGTDLLSFLSDTPIHVDDIVRLSGAPADEVLSSFLELELAGKITRHSGGRVSRIYGE